MNGLIAGDTVDIGIIGCPDFGNSILFLSRKFCHISAFIGHIEDRVITKAVFTLYFIADDAFYRIIRSQSSAVRERRRNTADKTCRSFFLDLTLAFR